MSQLSQDHQELEDLMLDTLMSQATLAIKEVKEMRAVLHSVARRALSVGFHYQEASVTERGVDLPAYYSPAGFMVNEDWLHRVFDVLKVPIPTSDTEARRAAGLCQSCHGDIPKGTTLCVPCGYRLLSAQKEWDARYPKAAQRSDLLRGVGER